MTPAMTAPRPAAPSIKPNEAGPRPSRSCTTTGSRAQRAEAKKKKAQARRMETRIAGTEIAKRIPARIADRKRSGGSFERVGVGRRQRSNAQSSTRKQRAFRENVAAGPAEAMAKPPNAGPSARAKLKPTPFSATACTRSLRETSSGIAAAQAGKITAVPAPIRKVSTRRPQAPSSPAVYDLLPTRCKTPRRVVTISPPAARPCAALRRCGRRPRATYPWLHRASRRRRSARDKSRAGAADIRSLLRAGQDGRGGSA